ncbi:MAG TPA: hypothetical protein DDW33_14180 [Ktedonobacter sp.]|nr:hypothetical protein [Ktedonobacter sp.]HBE26820.1 hypothetical protein [Ktedonobacter sp.]HCF85836.1 hypothetical protein [Ktedonobacter sp.]HCP75757.1 hypothetical protein [Ktedonobacter sp.]
MNAGEAIIARYSTARRAVNRLLAELRKRIPQFTTLPFVVYTSPWETTTGDENAPSVTEWNSVVNGLSPDAVTDMPGWEEHNQQALAQARDMRVEPKLYFNFDWGEEEGVDP